LLARLYGYPYDRWPYSRGRQVLFGAPNLALFAFLSKTGLCPRTGTFELKVGDQIRKVQFDARNTQFHAIYLSVFSKGFEPELTALFDIVIGPEDNFMDIGSNWGYFSLFVASKAGFKGKIWAAEPFPSTFRDLEITVQRAGLSERIQCLNIALSSYEGETSMSLPDFTHSGLAVLNPQDKAGGKRVHVQTLDSLGVSPAVIKIDAEGSEGDILEGARKLLSSGRPMIVVENWRNLQNPRQSLHPLQLLRDHGYMLFHPCWLRTIDPDLKVFVSAENAADARENETLALVPLTVEDRFLRQDQINVFACHESDLPRLSRMFEATSPAKSS
jgi:FkbM family methyltransferase